MTSATSASGSVQLLTDQDLYLFNEGSHYRLYDKMGAHLVTHNGEAGAVFSVWAPNARSVSVLGDFNGWDSKSHRLKSRGSSGIWEGFIPGVTRGGSVQIPHRIAAPRIPRRQSRPARPPTREAPAHRIGGVGPRVPMERPRMDGEARLAQFATRAPGDLRGASGFVDARPRGAQSSTDLPRDGAASRSNT